MTIDICPYCDRTVGPKQAIDSLGRKAHIACLSCLVPYAHHACFDTAVYWNPEIALIALNELLTEEQKQRVRNHVNVTKFRQWKGDLAACIEKKRAETPAVISPESLKPNILASETSDPDTEQT